jgi:3-phenylpropionate/trans-cinnamate dioxygenase ferredoxin reductase component
MPPKSIVIVGAGHAGVQLAASIREAGFDDKISILSDEIDLPYQRPQLSKAFLKAGDAAILPLRAEQFFADNAIDLLLGQEATRIDRQSSKLELRSGLTIGYDHLVIATGATSRPFETPGAKLDGIVTLRQLSDARSLRDRLASASHTVVVGAGFIGLEIAATATGFGKSVTIIEIGPRVMGRAVSPITSSFFGRAHESFGARLLLNSRVAAVRGQSGRATEVELSDGSVLPADLIVIGVGILPHDALASAAGIECANGIVVGETLASSDESISAIGDCAAFPCHFVDASIRLESVQNAVDQARCVAKRIVGKAERYVALPWFWSDQGDLKLQIAGLPQGVDEWITRGDFKARSFSVFGFRAGALAVVETVNRPGDHMAARKLLEGHVPLSPVEAADISFDLRRQALGSRRSG